MEHVHSYYWGEYLLHQAASEGDNDRLQQLLQDGHSPNVKGGTTCWIRGASEFYTRTPLHYAAKGAHLLCVRMLLKHGADPNSRDGDGYTPLHYVCQIFSPGSDRQEVLSLCLASLVECGADLRVRNNSGRTPLEIAQTQKNRICQQALQWHSRLCDLINTPS